MAIPPVAPFSSSGIVDAQSASPAVQVTASQQRRTAFNALILEAAEAQLSSKDQPLALALRAVIDKLNGLLEADLGPNAIDAAKESGLDVSPEATAERIVSLSTAFFPAFREANPDESGEQALSHFMEVIRSGIEQGFAEAREILEGLGVLQGGIASNIDLTFDLVQQKLDAFQQNFGQQNFG